MKRDLYWDSLKFVLIFLVVYGHIIARYAPEGSFNKAMYNLIYMFHMPLFIFVSGRFSHIRDKEKYKRGILRIFETYVIFQLIWAILPLLKQTDINWESQLLSLIYPRWTLWYLLSLVFWRIMVYAVPNTLFKNHPKIVLGVCVMVCLLVGFVPVGAQFSFQRTMAFLPFFFMGYYSTDIDVMKFVSKIPKSVSIVVLVSSFFIIYFMQNKSISYVTTCASPYWSVPTISPYIRCFERGLLLVAATIFGTMVMRLVPTKASLARWGSVTLVIYVYHSFAINALDAFVKRGYLQHDAISLFVYACAIMFVLVFISRFKVFTILLNPVSFFMNKKK